MALHDEILRDILLRRIPWSFKTTDLMWREVTPGRYLVGNREFSANTLKTVPINHSIRPDRSDPGDYVRKGGQAAYFWTGPGRYEPILDKPHCIEDADSVDETLVEEEGEGESLICAWVDKPVQRRRELTANIDDSGYATS